MQELTVDLAVIAGGPSGLAAAIAAAENGVSVALFEKSHVTGGAANMGMGPFAVESHIQKEMMENLTVDEAFAEFMEAVHWHVNAKLVRAYFEKSASTIEWLESMGVEFAGAMKYFPKAHRTWHVVKPEGGGKPGPRAAGTMTKIMTQHAIDLGVDVRLETPVKEILKEDGRICGVKAEMADGEEVICHSKAVLVATGGFGANSEMIESETGYHYGKDIFNTQIPGIVGDGLKMAWAAGAGHSPMMMEKIYDLRASAGNPILHGASHLFTQPGVVIVNKLGERIMDETFLQHTAYTSNVIDIQKDRTVYAIMDSSLLKYYKKRGMDVPSMIAHGDPLDALQPALDYSKENNLDTVVEADSLEELAAKTGIDKDALEQTIDEYNLYCEQNVDGEFNKNHKFLHAIKGPKYYAGRHCISAYGSLGGIKVNHRMEVMDDDFNIIPGFFASGNEVNTLYDGTYIFQFPGSSMGFAVNSGRMAGETAADYINSL